MIITRGTRLFYTIELKNVYETGQQKSTLTTVSEIKKIINNIKYNVKNIMFSNNNMIKATKIYSCTTDCVDTAATKIQSIVRKNLAEKTLKRKKISKELSYAPEKEYHPLYPGGKKYRKAKEHFNETLTKLEMSSLSNL